MSPQGRRPEAQQASVGIFSSSERKGVSKVSLVLRIHDLGADAAVSRISLAVPFTTKHFSPFIFLIDVYRQQRLRLNIYSIISPSYQCSARTSRLITLCTILRTGILDETRATSGSVVFRRNGRQSGMNSILDGRFCNPSTHPVVTDTFGVMVLENSCP